jgi:uncharacterized protein
MIKRELVAELKAAAREYPVVTLVGPRQSGKTTLVQAVFPDKPYQSLEDPDVRRTAQLDPRGFLAEFPDGCILDEIQRFPELLSYMQGIVDRRQSEGLFIVTGSHQPLLHQAISQSLAGRTALLTLLPFSLKELGQYNKKLEPFPLIVSGCFPRLHEKNLQPDRFFKGYFQTYVERDVRALINVKDLDQFQRFLTLIAGRIGQLVNYSSLGNDAGASSTTIKSWISVLKASYIVFELQPYYQNINKRVTKSSKLFFMDTGLAAYLLGISEAQQFARDPLRGGMYENFVILEFMKAYTNRGRLPQLFFYRDSHGNEVDLILKRGRKLFPIEIKSAMTFSESFLQGIDRFKEVVKSDQCEGGAVFFGGDQKTTIHGIRLANIFNESIDSFL